SSSMSSEGGDGATPLPIRIHEYLGLAAAPATVHSFGVGATLSSHTLLMRGLDTPALTPTAAPAPGSGSVPVDLAPGPAPQGTLPISGEVAGVPGGLVGSSGAWLYTPDESAQAVTAGPFVSALAATAQGSRQVLWVGKNNILDIEGVLADTQRI